MANKRITELPPGTTPMSGTEKIEAVQGGINKEFDAQDIANLASGVEHYRGDYAGGTTFPATGGTFTGSVPGAGDRWRLTGTLTIGGTDIYAAGTIIEAAIDTPGQTTGNWIKYAVQS